MFRLCNATGKTWWPNGAFRRRGGGPYSGCMARITGSWLSGPQAGLDNAQAEGAYRGEALGLPASGPGSLATSWRRTGGLLADWLMAGCISLGFVGFNSQHLSSVVLMVWFVVGVVTVSLFSFTPGQFLLGMRVARVDMNGAGVVRGGLISVGLWRAVVRQILIVFCVPALVTDADGRGMHDRATGTALVLTR